MNMEKEYIERGVLLEELQEEIDFESTMYTEEQNKWLRAGLSIAARDVRNQPTADVVPRDEVAKIFEEIERNIFKFETPYQTLHCIPSGFIEELKEKYTKGGEGDE
jgi:hypothetical protein